MLLPAVLLALLAPSQEDSRDLKPRLGKQAAEHLVGQLSSAKVEEREAAQERLRSIGMTVLPVLEPATRSPDPELARRARQLIEDIRRDERERLHDAEQRKAVLGDKNALHAPGSRAPFVGREGVGFYFLCRPYGGGTVVTNNMKAPRVTVSYDVSGARDRDDRDLVVERCGVCSPRMVYVRNRGAFQVRLHGALIWMSPYDLRFENPRKGDTKKVGCLTVELDWPTIAVTSSRDLPEHVLERVEGGFTIIDKNGEAVPHDYERGVDGGGFLGIGNSGEMKGWCNCTEGPRPLKPRKAVKSGRRTRALSLYEKLPSLADVSRIDVRVYKPIWETFDLTSPELKSRD